MRRPLSWMPPVTRSFVEQGDPEPAVGVSLRGGAHPGMGDHIRFDHVFDDPDRGWIEYVNSSPRGRRVCWPVVEFWLPMEVVLARAAAA